MTQVTNVRPEFFVKVCMVVAVLSLVAIAVCQIIQVIRPPQQPIMRRPVVPMENRMMQQGIPPFPPGMVSPGGAQGQGMPQGPMQRPPPVPGQGQGQPPEKPAKK